MVYRSVILLLLCVSSYTALPVSLQNYADAVITRFESSFLPFKGYSFSYETSDGQARQESADIQPISDREAALSVSGSYSYVGDDGNNYQVEYTADQDGFRPAGDHLPRSAGVQMRKLGIPSAAIASLAGGGLG